MAVQPPPHVSQILAGLNATYRFTTIGVTIEKDGALDKVIAPGCVKCEIIDLTTKQGYFTATGEDRAAALENAANGAIDAAKPLTPGQSYQRVVEAALDDKDKRIADLEAQLKKSKTKSEKKNLGSEPDTVT